MADSLNLLSKVVAHVDGGGVLNIRYTEMIHPPKEINESAEDIKNRILKGLKR